jgi:hypothetical protein
MRTAEWINTGAFVFLTGLAWLRRLDARRRFKITALGVTGLTINALSAGMVPRVMAPLPASVTRDWIPYVLLLLVYWQAGQFFTEANLVLERRLERIDERLIVPALAWLARHPAAQWMLMILEGAYLFCYASLPLGLGALYMAHRGREADHFWAVVLVSAYCCYLTLPFLQTRPPRMTKDPGVSVPLNPVRRLNLWVLRHASIQVNTIPSAHVAASTACALALLPREPAAGLGLVTVAAGLGFFALAAGIALGAAIGRYHYAADVILGALVGLLAFLMTTGM